MTDEGREMSNTHRQFAIRHGSCKVDTVYLLLARTLPDPTSSDCQPECMQAEALGRLTHRLAPNGNARVRYGWDTRISSQPATRRCSLDRVALADRWPTTPIRGRWLPRPIVLPIAGLLRANFYSYSGERSSHRLVVVHSSISVIAMEGTTGAL
jgi:hypothetical protein